jgi:hypothetical protein
MRYRRLLVLLLAALTAVGVSACGSERHPFDATAENNGFYVKGGEIEYQLQVSRALNPFSVEDHQFLTGLPTGTTPPTATQLWYGVFLWAQNAGKSPQTTTDSFDIVDTRGDKYYPVSINPAANQYAWTAERLLPQETEPGPDTTAAAGSTGGALVLFKLSTSVYADRPLTLEIHVPGESSVSSISLDL